LFITTQAVQAQESKITPYFSSEQVISAHGSILEKSIINGPPKPPVGYERSKVTLPEPDIAAGTNTKRIINISMDMKAIPRDLHINNLNFKLMQGIRF